MEGRIFEYPRWLTSRPEMSTGVDISVPEWRQRQARGENLGSPTSEEAK